MFLQKVFQPNVWLVATADLLKMCNYPYLLHDEFVSLVTLWNIFCLLCSALLEFSIYKIFYRDFCSRSTKEWIVKPSQKSVKNLPKIKKSKLNVNLCPLRYLRKFHIYIWRISSSQSWFVFNFSLFGNLFTSW